MAIEFVEEPPKQYRTGRSLPAARIEALALLRKNPGRWAKYSPSESDPFKTTRTISVAVMKGHSGFSPKGHWECKIRRNEVYIRYTGGNNELA